METTKLTFHHTTGGVHVMLVRCGERPRQICVLGRDEARSFADDLHRALPTRRERQVDGVVACMLVLVFVMGMIVIFG